MISLKKVFVAAAVATLGFGLFALSSKTNVATAGLFDTDVDNFVNVNEWSTVNPEKFFGYFGMDDGNYNVGFAKQFEKFYWGTYYDGYIGASSKNTYDAKTTADTTVTDWGNLTFANLFGFGNIGIKATLNFSGSKSVTEQKEPSVTTTKDSTSFYGDVSAGLTSFDLAGFNTKPYAYIRFDTCSSGSKEETNQKTIDSRRKMFGLGAGAEVTLSESETTTQTASAAVNFTNYTPYDTDQTAKATWFTLPLGYKVTYKASENLSLALGAGASIYYNTSDDSKTKVKESTFGFTPALRTGLTYDTKKKVIFNAGVRFDVPSYTNTKTDTDGKIDTTSNWSGDKCNLTWSSGFNWVPTKNVSVDCSYEILADLFDGNSTDNFSSNYDMSTDFDKKDTADFWNNVNKALVHNIGFSVSVKF